MVLQTKADNHRQATAKRMALEFVHIEADKKPLRIQCIPSSKTTLARTVIGGFSIYVTIIRFPSARSSSPTPIVCSLDFLWNEPSLPY